MLPTEREPKPVKLSLQFRILLYEAVALLRGAGA